MGLDNKRIAKNTFFLYIRQLFILFVSLYTSRVVLQTLGIDDYGIYNVVGGFVSLFLMISSSFNLSTQRFITYSIGENNKIKVQQSFSASFLIHLSLALIVLLLSETIGLWFINNELNIPPHRSEAAFWVFQFSVFSLMLNIIQIPYNALIISYEKMNIFALISTLEVILKLLLVLTLINIQFDKLKLYALLMFLVSSIIILLNIFYCYKMHKEDIKITLAIHKSIFKKMVIFSTWTTFSSSAWILKGQGVNVIMNLFFGPAINAARGITSQITSIATNFMLNFQMASNPQITKSYATGNLTDMETLIFRSIKFSYYLLFIIFVPIFFEIETILDIWLVNPPEYTAIFCRIIIIELLIDSCTGPLKTGVRATGNIKKYSICEFSILILNIPLTYFLFSRGFQPYYAYIVSAFLTLLAVILRLYIGKTIIGFSVSSCLKNVFIPTVRVTIITTISCLLICHLLNKNMLNNIIFIILSFVFSVISIYIGGLSKNEKLMLKNAINGIIFKK